VRDVRERDGRGGVRERAEDIVEGAVRDGWGRVCDAVAAAPEIDTSIDVRVCACALGQFVFVCEMADGHVLRVDEVGDDVV